MARSTMGGVFGQKCDFKLTPEMQERVREYLPMVKQAVEIDWWKWYMRGFPSKEDAIQTGTIRLMQCAYAWDKERAARAGGKTFRIYAWWYIRRYLRERGFYSFTVRAPRTTAYRDIPKVYDCDFNLLSHGDGTSGSEQRSGIDSAIVRDKLAYDDEGPGRCGDRQVVASLLTALTVRERRIMAAIYGLDGRGGLSVKVVAAAEGLSCSRVNLIRKEALSRMKLHAKRRFKQLGELCYAA